MDSTPARFGSDHGTLRSEDEPLLTGAGRFTDDLNVPDQAYAVFVRAPVEPRGDPQRRRVGGARNARRARRVHRPRSRAPTASARSRRSRSFPAATASRCSPPRCRCWRSIASATSARPSRSWSRRRWRRRRTRPSRCRSISKNSPMRPRYRAARPRAARRRSTTGRPATSRSTGPTATPPPSTPPSRRPRMSSACGSTTRGLRRSRWSRAPASACGTRRRRRYTLIASTQGVAVVRKLLAEGVFKVPLSTIRVLTHDVGGGFGMKAQAYPEYARDPLRGAQGRPAGEVVQQPDGELPLRLGTGATASWKASSRSTPRANSSALRVRNLVGHRRLHDAIRGDLLDR